MRRTYNQMQPPSSYGNLSNTTGIVQEFGAPVEDIQRVTANMFQTHETNRMAFEELQLLAEKDKELVRKEHESDVNIVNDRVSQIGTEINNFVDGGNFHNASKVLSKTFRKYVTDDGLNAAKGARAKQLEIMSQIDAMEGYSNEDKAKAKGIANSKTFNQAITRDENGNIVGGYYGWTPNEFVDAKELIKEFGANWKGDDITVEGYNIGKGQSMVGQNPFIEGSVTRRAGLSGEEYMEGVTNMLASDAKYQAYLNSKYMMDNFDPATGDIRVPNDNEMIGISYNNIPKLDTKTKKPIADDIRQKMAVEAYNGAVINLQNKYKENTGEELSREQAVKFLHKQEFISNEINNAAISLYHPYVHTISEQRQKLMADNIYTANYEKRINERIDFTQLYAEDETIDPNKMLANVKDLSIKLSMANASIDNIGKQLESTPNDLILKQSYDDAVKQKQELQASIDFQQSIFNKFSTQLSTEDRNNIIKNIGENMITQYGVYMPKDFIEDALMNNNIQVIISDLETRRNRELEKSTFGLEKFGINKKYDGAIKYIQGEYKKAFDRIPAEQLGFHKNYMIIHPEGNTTEQYQNMTLNHIKNGFSFETFTGESSTSTEFQNKIKGAKDVNFSFIADKSPGGDIMGFVVYKDDKGATIHSDYIIPPITTGTIKGIARDMYAASMSPHLNRFPERAIQNQQVAQSILTKYEDVYDKTGRIIGTLDQALKALSIEGLKSGQNIDDNYITFKRDHPTQGPSAIYISFEKVGGGVKLRSSVNPSDPNSWISEAGTKTNTNDWLPVIFNSLEKIYPINLLHIHAQ